MPQDGVKDFTLYVPGADVGSSLQVSLSGSGTIFMRQTVPVSRISNSTLFIGVL
ncbi:MAG: hypothetical protein JWO59_3575, partial [Chloroflexi bacterium]|nr:hypothetical protein [Chloroflexota bacterium]